MSDNQERMLEYLRRAPGWVTATELWGHLGVSARSVRSYVTRAKQVAHPFDIIDSGPDGYQLRLLFLHRGARAHDGAVNP